MKTFVLTVILTTCNLFILPARMIERDTIPRTDSIQVMSVSAAAEKTEENINFTPQVIPPSPQSAIYQKYLNHKIDESTGIPDISIPLYEIKLKETTIPIILSYHASGVKTCQYDGDVGAGWSINVGGYKVMRTVYGLQDERYHHFDDQGIGRYATVNEMSSSIERQNRDDYLQTFKYTHDSEYDHFSYILPSSSGEFIIQNGSNSDRITTLIAGPQQDKFAFSGKNEYYSFRTITVTDEHGTVYLLGGTNTRETAHDEPYSVIGWPLEKMTTRYKEEVNFTYKSYVTPLNARRVDYILYTEAPYYINYIPYNPPFSWSIRGSELPYIKEADYLSYNSKLVNSITAPNCKIVFVRRETSHGDTNKVSRHLITAVEIYNNANKLIKKINFEQSLATENGYNDHNLLQTMTVSGGSQPSPQEKYQFSYYPRTSLGPNYWGYGGIGTQMPDAFKRIPLLYEKVRAEVTPNDIYTNIYDKVGAQVLSSYHISIGDCSVKDTPTTDHSLKRITFPTGGFTEYEYEPHKDDNGTKIGGLRIKRIISKPEETASPVITEYQYADAHFEISLWPDDFVDDLHTIGFSNILFSDAPSLVYSCVRTVKFATTPTHGSLLDYRAYYGKVTKLQYDQNSGKYNGKVISVYGNIPSGEKRSISSTARITPFHGDQAINPSILFSETWSRSFWIDSNKGYSPTLTSRAYYDNNDQIKKEEIYTYTDIRKGTFRELRLKERIKVTNGAAIGNDYDYFAFRYDYATYDLKLGFFRPQTKRIVDYTDNITTTFDESYSYNKNHQLTRKSTSSLSESYLYPADFAEPVYRSMVTANILSPVIEKTQYGAGSSLGRIAQVKTNYENRNGIYLPASIQSKTFFSEYRNEITFDRYDSKGNIIQTTALNGISTVYIWAYKGQYPVAKIENATHTQLTGIIPQAMLDIIASRSEPTAFDLELLDNLRSNPALAYAFVSTYTYKPLVGILTTTDPAGIVTYYEYDPLGRLTRIKDHNGHTLEEYEYHYMSN